MPPLIEVTHRRGIYLPEADLWLDPHFGVERAFISHAHSDHFARHRLTYCSEVTRHIMRARYGEKETAEFQVLPLRQDFEQEGWRLRLYPAGHIVGSAMLHLTRLSDGATLLYTGDYKLRHGLSAEPCELPRADVLVMECTFGLPQYRFPPRQETVEAVLRWVRETLEDGGIPNLLGYSLGKAQEILRILAGSGYPVMLHKSVLEMTQAVAPVIGALPEHRLFDAAQALGHVLVFPPSANRSQPLRKLKVCRTAMLSGWAMQPGARYRYQVDEAFPLSDHADYDELLQTVETVNPKRVWLVHGSTREFAADLRARGWEAWTLEKEDQLEFLKIEDRSSWGTGVLPVLHAAPDAEPSSKFHPSDFAAWALTCARTAAEASRLKKTALLAEYLRSLPPDELALAARYCSGLVFDPAAGEAPLNTGWAVIRRALQELAGISEAEYRVISRSQADAGRTAFLMLGMRRAQAASSAPLTLAGADAFFRHLREARGPVLKTRLLRECLAASDAETGSWLVRLMTGELRMGSREGLIEEAIAQAFDQDADSVREAAMLCGDIGRAAQLAQTGRLNEAAPRLGVPVKVMLASPEETAEDIWERLGEDRGSKFEARNSKTEESTVSAIAPFPVLQTSNFEFRTSPTVWLEDKFDGIRAQLHRGANRAEIYTRDLKPVGFQFPEILDAARMMRDEVILDGEIIAYAEEKKLSFFDLQKRLGRRDQADLFLPSDIRVRYVVFDVLWRNGASLLERPLSERRAELEAVALPEPMGVIEIWQAASPFDIEAAFHAARRRGNEGLIAKDPAAAYRPGRRGKSWLKLKKAYATLDAVVVKAEQGHGKRSHVLSDYTFAVRDEAGALRVIGKAYSGLTDAEIEELTAHFTSNTLDQKGRVRTVLPDTVLEIAFDSIQPSNRHDSGLAMRFPRIKTIRRDKTPGEIDTLETARRLAGLPG
ncbi:MAG TPA: DNA ligase [Verrucomicrobiales bacterium]|nr:DNA ligase [Verrucomicrobiales bacterium]